MKPLLLFVIAIVAPLLLALTALVPSYAGIWAASYLVYELSAQPHTLLARVGDVFYVIDVYQRLLTYWLAHAMEASILKFALPMMVLPLIGLAIAFFLTRRVVRMLRDLSHLTSG